MPNEREYETALQQDPSHNEAFLFLRRRYRETGRFDKLVTLYEMRAQAVPDQSKAAELFYLAAEVRVDHLSDVTGAEADLAHAINRDATHRKAAKRLKDIYREQGRGAEYFNMLEVEAAAVGRSKDAARIAELRAEIDRTYGPYISRIETALATPGRRAEVTPDHLHLVESARKVLHALGDYHAVCHLYEIELAATTETKRRIGLMFRLGRVLAEKVGDLPQAAQKLSDVVRMYPRDDKALEALAAVYAHPNWTGSDGRERAAGLYNQIARRRYEAGDTDNAVASLRKALAAVPIHSEAQTLLERVLSESGRFADLDRFLRERIAAATSDQEKVQLLTKRARLAETSLSDVDEAISTYELVVPLEPPDGPAAQHLAKLYAGRHDFAKLAELRERQLERTTETTVRLSLLRELAALYRDRLGDREQAAVYLHAILQADPGDAEALKAYADHFRQRGSFRELADLLEFALEHDRSLGKPAAELLPRMEELAVLVEGKLSDMDRALTVWRRMVTIDPTYERAREAQKRILLRTSRWSEMVPLFVEDAERAVDSSQKVEILRRLARLYAEKLEDTESAVTVYMEILALDPRDATALRTVIETYEKSENWKALAALFRKQEEIASAETEKVGYLRRLLLLYEEKLFDPSSASWAATQILRYLPGDREALAHLEAILEKSNDKPRLVKMLEYHLRFAPSAEERLRIIKRVAELLQDDLQDYAKAIPYWEKLLQLVPGDARSIEALLFAYENVGRPEDLARILELQVKAKAEEPAVQAEALRRLARLSTTVLKQTGRAENAWTSLLGILPEDREGLEALSVIAEDMGDFTQLAGLLQRRIKCAANPAEAMDLALARARVFEEELRDPPEAILALEQILDTMDENHRVALQSLRRVSEGQGDWKRVVRVAEKLWGLASEPAEQLERGLELGRLYRDRLDDVPEAIRIFERVLEVDSSCPEALEALSVLYKNTGNGERFLAIQEKILVATTDPIARREHYFSAAEVALYLVQSPARAFAYYRQAYHELPDDVTLGRVEKTAEEFQLWEDLVHVYFDAVEKATLPHEHIELARKIASICEKRLEHPRRAFTSLRDALAYEPTGITLLPEIERLARILSDFEALLDVYTLIAQSRTSTEERIELFRKRAKLREDDLEDPSGAMDEYLHAFSLDPDSQTSHQEILRLADASSRWEDALQVESQIFARSSSVPIKIEIARRAAHLVETKVKDDVRAFRAYLNAFRLSPEDADVGAHLWRLATKIGRYGLLPIVSSSKVLSGPGLSKPNEVTAELDLDQIIPEQGLLTTPTPVGVEGMAAVTPLAELDPIEVTGEIDVLDIDILEEAPARAASPEIGRTGKPRGSQAFQSPWHEWVQVYEGLPADVVTRHRYLLRQAEIWEKGAKEYDSALDTLERAFFLNTKDETVWAELERLAGEYDRWDRVCGMYQRAAERAQREEAVTLNLRAAKIREDISQVDRAEDRYRAVLVLDPSSTLALNRLESIYRGSERWSDLATVLERRTMAGDGQLRGMEMRARAFELAELYEQRLERPYEAVETLERFVASIEEELLQDSSQSMVAEARAGYAALARLLGKVGMAQKAAAALQRELDLADEGPEARSARTRLADLFEHELGLPAKAVEVYEAILQRTPDDEAALGAVDRLLQASAQFERLSEMLDRRIQRASGQEKNELIWRRARLLEEKMGNPDGAAACLRQLGPEALNDEAIATSLLRNLRSAKLYHEAIRMLDQRIELAAKMDSESGYLSGLYIEKAQLLANDLDDLAGAIAAVEESLKISPADSVALSELARYHLKRNDFQSYATTLLRKAKALAGTPETVAVLLEASAVFRDQLGDSLQARVCLERAVGDHPTHEDALSALASLEAAEGRLEAARLLYERLLESSESPTAKAGVLTRLARVLCENPELLSEAEARLDQALEIEPGYLPAVVTLADIYYREQQWPKAERRLNEALRRLRGQPEQTARLYHRLGEVYEKLGRLEEGYRQLLEADRAMPGQLMLRIALVENRFQAHRWREAALHVEGVAEHPQAQQYSEEVAQALTHGALAELHMKRPERAAILNEAALQFSPSHPQTLRALADLAIERGDKLEAARSLRRVAECSANQSERIQIFEQIGDLYLSLSNREAARLAYREAVSTLEDASPAHISLFEKLLDLEKSEGDLRSAITTARRIAESVEPGERAVRRREVAALQLQEGDPLAAAEMLEKVLEDATTDEIALHQLCDAYAQAGRANAVAATLERLLPQLPPATDPAVDRARSLLWERLGAAVSLRDVGEGISAFEKAVTADPGRISARMSLARLYEQNPDRATLAAENHQAILRIEPTSEGSLRWLATYDLKNGQVDPAHCYLEVLSLLGRLQEEEQALLRRHPLLPRGTDEPFAGTIDDELRSHRLAHPATRILGEVFASLWEGLPSLNPNTLEALGVGTKDKVSAISDLDVAKIYSQVGKALANQRAGLYLRVEGDKNTLQLLPTPPTGIVVGAELIADASDEELRFRIGRALELLRPEHILAATMDPLALDDLFLSVLKAFHPKYNRWRAGSEDSAVEEASKLKKSLPYKYAKRIAEIFQEHSDEDFDCVAWRSTVFETGNRAGLLLCGDLTTAARIVLKEQVVPSPRSVGPSEFFEYAQTPGLFRELLRYFISPHHLELRRVLGVTAKAVNS